MSVTIILNEQVEVFPDGSVAIEFTVVDPTGKTLPDGGFVIRVDVQLSAEVTVKFTTAPQSFASVFTYISAGQFITGSSISITVTLNEQSEVFPDASVATELTVVVPTEKKLPEDGFETTVEEQLSEEVEIKFTTAPQ